MGTEKTTEEKLASAQLAIAGKAKELETAQEQLATEAKARQDLESQLAEAKVALAKRSTPMKLDPNAPYVAKVRIRTANEVKDKEGNVISSAASIEKNEPLTFDPRKPPTGFNGLIEGVHYERAKVLVPAHA